MPNNPFSRHLPNVARSDDPRLVQPGGAQEAQDELINLMTIMYVIVQEALSFPKELESTRTNLRKHISTSLAMSYS